MTPSITDFKAVSANFKSGSKALLTGVFFINLDKFPQEPKKILVLGAGIGTINYYFNKIFKNN
ncbi:MAG: hypothetical protein HUJ63_06550, partial [Enterococcus sp.]|nr:hypothetical protein [Enterococcus sp.]